MEEKKQESNLSLGLDPVAKCKEPGCCNDALKDQEYCKKHLDDHWLLEYKSKGWVKSNGK